MANEVLNATISTDQRKFLAAKLIARAQLKLMAASLCTKVKQAEGSGKTAYFVRYSRINVPLATLTEGTTPGNNAIAVEEFSVQLDQWGDVITIADIPLLTAAHPLMEQVNELLADNAQRVIDREIQNVWLAGTNVQYGDGSVTSRAAVTSSMKLSDSVLHKARITLQNAGTPERGGPEDKDHTLGNGAPHIGSGNYVAVSGPEVIADLMTASTSLGSFASVAMYANQKALYNGEVGTWLGFRFVMTNFIPKFQILGNTTAAVASGAAFGSDTPIVTAVDGGGSLTSGATYYYKVSRKKKDRGFEEFISIEHTTAAAATGNNESFTFNFSSLTAGYVYNLYFGSATGNSNLKLASENIEVGTTVTVTAVPSSTTTAPANVNTTGTPAIHPVYIHGAGSCMWVGLQDLKFFVTPAAASDSDPLVQRRKVGYKFMAKALVPDQLRLLRLELAATN